MPLDENTFIYASLKSDSVRYVVDENGYLRMPVREFYKAIKKNNKWVGGYDSPFPVNEPNINVGNGVLSKDGTHFYYTRCNERHGPRLLCSIYLSIRKNKKWEKPVKQENEINIGGYTSTQPALGFNSKNNNEILYFISDRKNGKGGLDLWYVEYDINKNTFKKPKNYGGTINTPAEELEVSYKNIRIINHFTINILK